jgi:outer membrane protein assembly factor BamB
LVCSPGGSDATIVALNKGDGSVIWKCPLPDGDEAGYASAIIVEVDGIKQYVQFMQKGVVGVDAKTGKVLWQYTKTAQGSPANIPTPVAKNAFVYTATNKAGGGLVKLTVDKDKVTATEQYFSSKLPTAIGGSIPIGDYLYGTGGRAGLMCVEFASGDQKWQDKSIGAASLLLADGRLYLHGESGEVALVEPSPEAYVEKGRFTPRDQPDKGNKKAWAYPVIANGRLYLRDWNCLWSYDVRK